MTKKKVKMKMKPDRIQLRPPLESQTPWLEVDPALTQSYDFQSSLEAALFLIYALEVAKECDEITVKHTLIGSSLGLTVRPVDAGYLTNAVYEYAALIDAAIDALRPNRSDAEDKG